MIPAIRRGLGAALLWACAVLLAVMTALVIYQIVTRYVLGSPVAFTEELVRYALIWLTFLAGTYAFVHREHMALTILRDRFPGRSRTVLVTAIDALVLVLAVLVLGIGGGMLAWESRGDVSALLGISRGWVYLISPVAGLAIALAQALNIIDDLRADDGAEPTAPAARKEAA